MNAMETQEKIEKIETLKSPLNDKPPENGAVRDNPLPGKMVLTQLQEKQFRENGFLVIENALTPEEVRQSLALVDRADAEITSDVKGGRRPGDPLEVRNSVAVFPELLPLLDHKKIFPYILDLMGPDIALTTSHIFIRPPSPHGTPENYKAIDWHRDGPTPHTREVNGALPWLYTKIGYFLTDLTIPNAGALRVVPGSNRYAGPAPSQGGEPYGPTEVKVKAGSAVIFENRLFHAVGPNYSPLARKNIYLGYCYRYLRPIDYVAQSEGLLAQATPHQKQLLGAASSSLGYYLPREEDVPLAHWYQERTRGEARQVKGNI